MNPVLQFDPASLGLWYGYARQQTAEATTAMTDVSWEAMFGDVGTTVELLDNIDPSLRVRAIALASSIWHEQRHFVDVLLTNHGAFATRQYMTLYANVRELLRAPYGRLGSIMFPIDVYLDPVRRSIYNLPELDEDTLWLIRTMVHRVEMMVDDRAPMPTSLGGIEVGGKAQLEALAYIHQMARVQELFGRDTLIEVQQSLPNAAEVRSKYAWIFYLMPHLCGRWRETGLFEVNIGAVAALLVGALATRRWGQPQIRNERVGGSGFAAERLAGLATFLNDRWGAGLPECAERAWHDVNDAAEQLWGRSVLDEMKEDIRREAEFINKVQDKFGCDHVVPRFARDVHRARATLFALLESDPNSILMPNWAQETVEIRPPVIIVATHSMEGKPPDGWERIFGYVEHDSGHMWWWAASPAPPERTGPITLADREAWVDVVAHYAPVAKLMMHGRRHRIMLGPEVLTVENQLHVVGADIRYEPGFEYPAEPPETKGFWYHTGRSTAKCDACRLQINAPGGHCVSPWVFRLNESIARWMVAKYGGGEKGARKYLSDWSFWLLCDKCRAEVSAIVGPRGRVLLGY